MQLVSPPDRRGDVGHGVDQPAGDDRIGGDPVTLDRPAEVGDHAAPPAADLVAEQAQAGEMAAADGAGGDDAAARLVGVRRRRDLDGVVVDDERGVVEVAARPAVERRIDGLEDAAVEADGVTARTQRDPVEVGAGQ